VRIVGRRWSIEEGFAQAKGEVGLDHDDVRQWTAWYWYRYITLCVLGQAFLAVLCAQARERDNRRQKRGCRTR
jgi:SRSO17 transposase